MASHRREISKIIHSKMILEAIFCTTMLFASKTFKAERFIIAQKRLYRSLIGFEIKKDFLIVKSRIFIL